MVYLQYLQYIYNKISTIHVYGKYTNRPMDLLWVLYSLTLSAKLI